MATPILVSACLLGLPTRYDGKAKPVESVRAYLAENKLIPIPVCPEQLGGLPTPREPATFASGQGEDAFNGQTNILTEGGLDVTDAFIAGAERTLKIAQLCGCKGAILKSKSPSCSPHKIYHGPRLVPGRGTAAFLLIRAGMRVQSEEEL